MVENPRLMGVGEIGVRGRGVLAREADVVVMVGTARVSFGRATRTSILIVFGGDVFGGKTVKFLKLAALNAESEDAARYGSDQQRRLKNLRCLREGERLRL